MGGGGQEIGRYKFSNVYKTFIFYIHNVVMLKNIILKKNRCYRPEFSFISVYSRTVK